MNIIKTSALVSVAVMALAIGCKSNPADKASQAKAAAPVTEVTAKPAPKSKTESLTITPKSGSIRFVGAKISDTHEGSFEDFNGTLKLVDGDFSKSKVNLTIKVPSLKIEPAKLAGHLLTPDFFDPAKYPTASFSSTSIKAGGAKGATHTVTGNLTLRGVKKSISFPAKLNSTSGSTAVNAEFAINRKDFGIVYPGMPDDLIKDNVLIKLAFKLGA